MEAKNDFTIKNSSAELYKELVHDYGNRIKRGGNMSKNEFFDMIISDVIETEYIIPMDFNDIRTIFDYAQEVDAVSLNCKANEFSLSIERAIGILQKHHQQSKIRNLAIIISLSQQDKPSPLTIKPMADVLQLLDNDFVWCLAKHDDVKLGDLSILVIAGFYQDVNNDFVRTSLSKKLAYLLRHSNLIDSQGFCQVLTAMQHIGVTYDELQTIIDKDNKNRFEIIGDSVVEARIRARNGHSRKVEIDPGLKLMTPPQILYHATTLLAWDKIKEEGLKPMSRQYVQLTDNPDIAIKAAERHKDSAHLLLEIAAYTAHCCGVHFYKTTSNGIWQVEYMPPYYIKEVSSCAKKNNHL